MKNSADFKIGEISWDGILGVSLVLPGSEEFLRGFLVVPWEREVLRRIKPWRWRLVVEHLRELRILGKICNRTQL